MSSDNEKEWIPNLDIGKDYDTRFVDASIHYDSLTGLASFFGRNMSVHRHAEHIQIHYIRSGNTDFHIDDKIYHVSGNALFLTPAATPHSFRTDNDVTGHVLTIRQSLVWQLFSPSERRYEMEKFKAGICISFNGLTLQQQQLWLTIEQLWKNIEFEWSCDYPDRHTALENYVSVMLVMIARLSDKESIGASIISDDIRLYSRFNKLIEKHYKSNWTVPDYAKEVGVSESRLNQLCQRVSQRSPKHIVNERRLQEIKRLLTFTDLSMNEIAFEAGFTDPAYFSRFFKRLVKCSPQQYRRTA